jgi:hypothetical protein
MRLIAIENLVANAWAVLCLQAGPSTALATFEAARKQMLQGAHNQTFPDVDPAMSDLLSAELESAIDRMAKSVAEQIAVATGLKTLGS